MALISAALLLRTIAVFHFTAAYYLLTSPLVVTEQNLVWILGAAMEIPEPPSSLTTPSPALALAALFLALLGLTDLSATNLDAEVANWYWSSQAPVRLLFFFAVTAYSYLYKPDGPMRPKSRVVGRVGKAGLGDNVCNGVVFAWGFLSVMMWFWIYVKLREERREILEKKELRRKAEEDRL
ncbi:hypothetical protein MMC21_004069 [Puttea exsequens]|nr:hypothetical protein [Puttea exsequens]